MLILFAIWVKILKFICKACFYHMPCLRPELEEVVQSCDLHQETVRVRGGVTDHNRAHWGRKTPSQTSRLTRTAAPTSLWVWGQVSWLGSSGGCRGRSHLCSCLELLWSEGFLISVWSRACCTLIISRNWVKVSYARSDSDGCSDSSEGQNVGNSNNNVTVLPIWYIDLMHTYWKWFFFINFLLIKLFLILYNWLCCVFGFFFKALIPGSLTLWTLIPVVIDDLFLFSEIQESLVDQII